MNTRRIKNIFLESYGWNEFPEGRGQFSVTPDRGSIKRIFLADIKVKDDGRDLLGVLGLYIDGSLFGNGAGQELSAYITNFPDFFSPVRIRDEDSAHRWVKSLVDGIMRIPIDPKIILKDWNNGKLGPFDARHFLVSSPNCDKFIEKIRDLAGGIERDA